jgi:plasmid stabilization system protein ParE
MADLRVTSAAERDYTDALCWYAERSISVAEAFESAIDAAFAVIASSPDRFPKCNDQDRYYLLDRFPYQVIYRVKSNEVWVIAIAHTSRDPEYWSKR